MHNHAWIPRAPPVEQPAGVRAWNFGVSGAVCPVVARDLTLRVRAEVIGFVNPHILIR